MHNLRSPCRDDEAVQDIRRGAQARARSAQKRWTSAELFHSKDYSTPESTHRYPIPWILSTHRYAIPWILSQARVDGTRQVVSQPAYRVLCLDECQREGARAAWALAR
eukprot:6214539-Pleurochrysis_carterae.AAC.5